MSDSQIHSSAFVEPGAQIHEGVRVWHFCHVREGAVLEEGVSLGKDVYVDRGVVIGRHSRIQNGVSLFQGVEVAPWCFIGPHVIFTNDQSPRAGSTHWHMTKTILKEGMSIGAGAVIRCGVTLGEFSMVGAGAIVTKSIPPFHLVMGFPAVNKKMVCACGQTYLPLKSVVSELIRDCCLKNLKKEPLSLARVALNLS